ncbi:MAG: class I SAM-dependent methyltransferase [Bacillota bacterium]
MDNHIRLFNLIAPFYNLFFKMQTKNYRTLIEKNIDKIDISEDAQILDLGSGTGAFGYCWQEKGYEVKGVEASPNMYKRCLSNGVDCEKIDITEGLPFADNSFELVTAAYLIHGLTEEKRRILYKETKRVASEYVIYHDYHQNDYLLIKIIEFLEGGDYFDFVKNVPEEFGEYFEDFKIVKNSPWNSWYIFKIH